jgi:hypothetical protein
VLVYTIEMSVIGDWVILDTLDVNGIERDNTLLPSLQRRLARLHEEQQGLRRVFQTQSSNIRVQLLRPHIKCLERGSR